MQCALDGHLPAHFHMTGHDQPTAEREHLSRTAEERVPLHNDQQAAGTGQ